MRDASPALQAAITRGGSPTLEVTSWLGADPLGTVPAVRDSWQISDKADSKTGGGFTFDVPNTPDNRPVSEFHQLGNVGQVLRVKVGHTTSQGDTEWLGMGRYTIVDVIPDGDVLRVEAASALTNVARARFLQPYSTTTGQTRSTAIRYLCRDIIPVSIEVTDDTLGAPTTWDRERIDALSDLVEGYPGRSAVDDDGVLVITDPWQPSDPTVYTIWDGVNLVEVQPAEARGRACNAYVIATIPKGDAQPIVEIVTQKAGPLRWGGPYGYEPGFWSSPLLTGNRAIMRRIGQNMLNRSQQRGRRWTVTALPNPRVQVGDVIHVRSIRTGLDAALRTIEVVHSRRALIVTVAPLEEVFE